VGFKPNKKSAKKGGLVVLPVAIKSLVDKPIKSLVDKPIKSLVDKPIKSILC
jgi:hypothetical protein